MMGWGYGGGFGYGFGALLVLIYVGAIVYGFYLLANIAAATKRSAYALERLAQHLEQGGHHHGGFYRGGPMPQQNVPYQGHPAPADRQPPTHQGPPAHQGPPTQE